MTREEMIKIIIKMYYVVAQEAVLNDLCYELEIDDLIDDGLDDEEA